MNVFLFITAFFITVIIMGVFIFEAKNSGSDKKSNLLINICSVARGMSVFMLIVGITDKFRLIDFGLYFGAYFLMGVGCAGAYILCEYKKRHDIKLIGSALKIITAALVLELTFFNASAYRTFFGDYREITYQASRPLLEKGGIYRRSDNSFAVRNGEEMVIRIPEVNRQVSTIYLDMSLATGTRSAKLSVDATDETQHYKPRENIATGIVSRNQISTNYIQCELSGNVGELIIKLAPINSGSAQINSITLNAPMPLEVSWVRFLFITLISIFTLAVTKGSFMQKSVTENKRFCDTAIMAVTVFACVWAIEVTTYRLDGGSWKDKFYNTEGNQVTQQLVDSFGNGRAYLYPEPDEALNSFDNPYDTQHRDAMLVPQWEDSYAKNSAWDHVYYNGKFYSYYGIAPVILLFLPYHTLTGYYLSDFVAVLIFAVIGMAGLALFFRKMIYKFFPSLSTGIFISGYIIMLMTCGIWYSIGRPLFYEVAMSAGFAFMTWGFYFLISANIIGDGQISLSKTAIASFLFATAVLSRPTTVLYCLCVAVFMLCALPEFSKCRKKEIKAMKKRRTNFLICAITPMACLGLVQMIYNYVRFGSPFEFGIQYSLTINDFRNTQFHWRLSLIPFYNYLFNAPVFSAEYPFISANFQQMGVNGFFYNDYPSTHNVCGLFFLAPPLFAYALSGRALRTFPDKKERTRKALYVLFPCVVVPVIIICSVWESGYSIRYMTDFAWQMLTGAYVILFTLYVKSKNPTVKKLISVFFCVALAWTVIVSGVQSFNQEFRYCDSHYDYPEMAYELEKIFMFWK